MVYKVEIDLRDGDDGDAHPSRHFSMLIDESRKGVFQAARRVPVATGSPQSVDVGVNIECTVHESGGQAILQGVIELTSIAGYVNIGAISQPIIGQRKLSFNTTVEPGTPTVIADDRIVSATGPVSLTRTYAAGSGTPAKPLTVAATHVVEATVTKVN